MVKFSTKLMSKALSQRTKCAILYATETGKSEQFAKKLAEVYRHAFDVKVLINLYFPTLLELLRTFFFNSIKT